MKKKKLTVGWYLPKWLTAIGILYIISITIFFGIAALVAGFIAFACADQCYKWATNTGKNNIIAFFIGLFFSLIGLLVYFIYSRSQK